MTKNLVLEGIAKKYGDKYAVKDMDLEIKEGELLTLLGPSGCGKTTTLRMIAGFEKPDAGKLIYNNKIINDLIPQRRNFGIVFQSYALFPHMKVKENVAFGLEMHKRPKNIIKDRVDSLLNMVGLLEHKEKYPPQLSGGMQQRVALVRALAPNPEVILLDEPLSALDAKIRLKLRGEIKQLQADLGITTIYVTHDQEEALAISDRIVIMKQGSIEQIGDPISIYKRPLSQYVANFVGTSNFFKGKLKDGYIVGDNFKIKTTKTKESNFDSVYGAIRPEKVEIMVGSPDKERPKENLLEGKLIVVNYLGLMVRLLFRVGEMEIVIDCLERGFEEMKIKRGETLTLYFPPEEFMVFKDE
ncbi:MAG TPA: ABC transporter ATP-binding protein [Candidatus Atribacteria bacterium]|nr:ABC transporter ATP-binding protein [Candidatus Atribacteria bacterium]